MNDDVRIRAFLTKYALTDGIIEIEGTVSPNTPTMFCYRLPTSPFEQYAHKGKWWRTREEAVAKAEQMRVNKLKALRKQIAKFEALRFA